MTPQLDTTNTGPSHPQWLREVQLEKDMLCLGADRVREGVLKAQQHRQMTTTRPVNRLLRDWLPIVADGIKDWRRASIAARGVKPISLAYIQDADASLLAMIALREVLDSVGSRYAKPLRMSVEIGEAVEHELKMKHWEACDPVSFKRAQRYFDKEGSSDSHRKKGNIFLFNREADEGGPNADWRKWSHEVHRCVGITLLDAIVRHTGWFSIEYAEPEGHTSEKRHTPLLLVPNERLMVWLAEAFDRQELFHPHFGPTLIPPRPWEGNRGGGYWTSYVKPKPLVHFKATQEEEPQMASEEANSFDMPLVIQAVNFIQRVPWKVNRHIFGIVRECWRLDLGIAGLPSKTPAPPPPPLEGTDITPEAIKVRRRAAKGVKKRNNSLVSRQASSLAIYDAAKDYLIEDRFYFPHSLDFRGRMYSIPSGLSPQGHDLARGLLTFADAKPITKGNRGAYWLALHLANMMGMDKLSNEDRIAWVERGREEWLAVAADPVGQRQVWQGGSHPWQALAAILDWAGYLQHGDGYLSSLPVMVDGTCNGLQHLSALLKDRDAAAMVNLVPVDAPADIYAMVAKKWQAALEAIQAEGGEEGQQADFFLGLWAGSLPRSSTKRQVMVLPYGCTIEAFRRYTREAANEASPPDNDATQQAYTFRSKAINMAAHTLWKIVNECLPGAMAIMSWLQECSKLLTEGNQPIYWVAPSGFVVRHFYGQQVVGRLRLTLNGRRMLLTTLTTTKDLDQTRQTRGVAPNFIHSLDAATLILTCNSCEEQGITHLTGIHDAYGTHAANMDKLSPLLRQAFVEVHESQPLEIFWMGCQQVLEGIYRAKGATPKAAAALAAKQRPPLPPMGTLDIHDVLNSPYFFS